MRFVFVVLLLLGGLVCPRREEAQQPQTHQPPSGDTTSPVSSTQAPQVQRQQQATQHESHWANQAFGPGSLSNWAVVFVAIWAGFIAKRSLKAIERQGEHMESQVGLMEKQILAGSDTTQRQLRAYICLESAALDLSEPAFPIPHLLFKNCGETPAYDVRGWIHTWIASHPLSESLPTPPEDLLKGKNTLGPGGHTTFVGQRKDALHNFVVQNFGTPKITFYVYGQIHYRDAFGIERYTNYRLFFGGRVDKVQTELENGVEVWVLSPDIDGNDCT